jgi:predicted DNA-binding transcriptional regulator YafY
MRGVPRNAEVIRQWTILRAIESARGAGMTIDGLATECEVTTRTIRRDLEALQEAGFPLYDDKSDDGRTRWHFDGQALKGLGAGLTLSELCALYFSRTLVETLAGTPFRDDVESAFGKLASGLTPHMTKFLDQLPRVIAAKRDPIRRYDAARPIMTKLIDATLQNRQATLRYHSEASKRTKSYVLHPYRLVYAQGGLYLIAFVPEYGETRTFAVERIADVSLHEERFTPPDNLPEDAFPHSLGVHSGEPVHVEVEFQPTVAAYVQSRQWHPSQQVAELPNGAVRMTLEVCADLALQSWILSFGPGARVTAPDSLVTEIAGRIEAARAHYATVRRQSDC